MEDRERKLKCQALTCACIDQDVPALTRLLLDPVYRALVDHLGLGGQAPLHIAILSKNIDILSMLLGAGADRNRRNMNGDMPMHCACRVGFLEGLKLLCSYRRIVTDALNDAGQLPLDIAVSTETESMRECDLYGTFRVRESRLDTSIIDIQGRRACAEYLRTVSARQRVERMNDYFDETVELNRTKQKVTNVLRDSNKGRSKLYYANFLKPPAGTVDCWNDRDYQMFERSLSLFSRMIVSVGSVCLVSSLMASTILAYDEKKAVEHQLWLYSRRKGLDEPMPAGVSKNREFFKTPVAESGKRDNLSEYDYTSYDIDDIMSDEEAEYMEATDDMVTSMLLLAMQQSSRPTASLLGSMSEDFVDDILTLGLEKTSRSILNKAHSLTFSNFSKQFVSSIVSTGLKIAAGSGTDGAVSFSESLLQRTVATGLDRATGDERTAALVQGVAGAFVKGVLSASTQNATQGMPQESVASFSQKLVAQLLAEGVRTFKSADDVALKKHHSTKVSKEDVDTAQKFVEHTIQALSVDDELTNDSVLAAFAKSFVARLLELHSATDTNLDTCISEFSSSFVDLIITSALSPPGDPTGAKSTDSPNVEVEVELSFAEAFVKTIVSKGLRLFDDSLSTEEEQSYVSEIVASFKPSDTSPGMTLSCCLRFI